MGITTPSLTPDEFTEPSGETQIQFQTAEMGNLSSLAASPLNDASTDYFENMENVQVHAPAGRSDDDMSQNAPDRTR